MSAAAIEIIAAQAGLEASAPPSARPDHDTRAVAVAVHLDGGRVRRAFRAREAAARAGCRPAEPGLDLARIGAEVRTADRRDALQAAFTLVVAAALVVPRPEDPRTWIGAVLAAVTIELAFRVARLAYVRRNLGPETFPGVGGGAPGSFRFGGRRRSVLVGSPRAPYPGTGREIDAAVFSVDLARPREDRRVPRAPRICDLYRETELAIRRLWIGRLRSSRRGHALAPGGPVRDFLALELPVGEEGALLTALIRFDRQGDVLLVEARFRLLPPLSRDLRTVARLDPQRSVRELAGDAAASLLCSPLGWLGALGRIGSGVLRPAIAAARGNGVQERSLREHLAEREPGEVLEIEAAQLAMAIRERFLDGLADSLARRGICPDRVPAYAAWGDVSAAEDPPVRAPRLLRRRPRAPRSRPLRRVR